MQDIVVLELRNVVVLGFEGKFSPVAQKLHLAGEEFECSDKFRGVYDATSPHLAV